MNNLLTGFADELVKVGTITNVLKQYRRARSNHQAEVLVARNPAG